jgi:hypothetical protein
MSFPEIFGLVSFLIHALLSYVASGHSPFGRDLTPTYTLMPQGHGQMPYDPAEPVCQDRKPGVSPIFQKPSIPDSKKANPMKILRF